MIKAGFWPLAPLLLPSSGLSDFLACRLPGLHSPLEPRASSEGHDEHITCVVPSQSPGAKALSADAEDMSRRSRLFITSKRQ